MHNQNHGIYVSCSYQETSVAALSSWLENHKDLIKFPIPKELIHTTVVYSRKGFDNPPDFCSLNEHVKQFKFTPKGIGLLGKSEDLERALVLFLDAPELENIHRFLISCGADHGWPDYIPHVTLSYSVPIDFDVDKLTVPNFEIVPESFNIEPLNENWCVQSTNT